MKKSSTIHILLCGLRGSGKTLLLYKTLIPKWESTNSEILPTPLYHYEEFKHNGKTLGLWDFSGDPVVRNISNYVSRQVEVRGVVFVVNILDMNETKNTEVINWLCSLESESSLSYSRFVVLFNGTNDLFRGENYENFMQKLEPIKSRLGSRIMCKNVNTIKGLDDPGWPIVLDFIISQPSNSNKKSNKSRE
ncbi:adp-ribosylation factor (ARF homologue), putative [Theileria annulata]|uniref:Adp-ribosylation factor (ARF homologue), putative n=1 Tax=Theileria annulata TaxID=5874 RepID=Q4UAU3_THEAN|nr:adp-ribosylation factor (ARF homologue), putative [Theileria annulata]CAI76058.1 adp-ribosylation factor (ARF homologue), putative [Theileria annulata]|eukprot:XP_955534.1 adp-ribosylation factor (ARF homologue), putative [Theileria annulata]